MTKIMAFFEALNLVCVHLSFWDITFSFLGLFLFTCILQRMTSKGPMLWPVVGIVPSVVVNFNNLYDWVTIAFIKAKGTFEYRGVWMGGAHGILTVDPSNIEYMLKTRIKNFPKGKYYKERFCDLLGDGIFNADDELWLQQRRVAIVEMHSSRFVKYSFQTMQDLVQQKLLKLTNKLANSTEDHIIDLQELLLRFTFDNICTAALGVDSGCLALDLPEVPFAKAFEEATELTLFRFLVPPFVWKPMKLFGLGSEKRLKEAAKVVHDFAEKIVMDRRSELVEQGSLDGRSDLLSRLVVMDNSITTSRPNEQSLFSNKLLRDFCISFILAGRDTSSVGLAWFFWLLQKNPGIETKILDEINDILSRREAKDNDDEEEEEEIVFSMEELKQMVYLQAALTESLRLYPPVPIDFKEVANDDVFPDGTVVKKGARVMYCIFSMARMEWIWGKECLEFKPERWIQNGQLVIESQFKYAVFNGGPRLCLGKTFAYMQMKMVAAAILLRYQVKVVEGQNVVPKITTTLYMKNGLLVSFKPRLANSAL